MSDNGIAWNDWAKEETNPDKAKEKPQALEDLMVLDLSYGSFAGLFASSLLAEMGAFVIRIEPPEGDIARQFSPDGLKIKDTGLGYIVEGRNKYHITLDIESSKGREILLKLAAKADILIETFPPSYMDELDMGWDVLKKINPALIYCAINNWGQDGPAVEEGMGKDCLDYDIIAQALSGFAWTVGLPEDYTDFPEHTRVPTRMGNWMGWYVGGAMAAFSIMTAILFREATGIGQFLDISPAESLMTLNNYALHFYHLTGQIINRVANFEPAAYAYNYVQAKDGMVFLAGYADPNWKALCSIIGRPDLVEKYPTVKIRTQPKNFVPMTREIEKFTKQYTREEIQKIWMDYSGPGVTVAGEILKPDETMEISHWYERKALVKTKDKDYGDVLLQGVVAKMDKTPPALKWICRPVGADNVLVYKKLLGFGEADLENLKKEGVI